MLATSGRVAARTAGPNPPTTNTATTNVVDGISITVLLPDGDVLATTHDARHPIRVPTRYRVDER
jgi:hypothetical protein